VERLARHRDPPQRLPPALVEAVEVLLVHEPAGALDEDGVDAELRPRPEVVRQGTETRLVEADGRRAGRLPTVVERGRRPVWGRGVLGDDAHARRECCEQYENRRSCHRSSSG
jgi:hypothetical protein